jgi:CBS domain-containing protein
MAVKSFQGPRAKQVKESKEPILVSDYMTKNLITFHPEQSILEVMELFIQHGISGGPVLDDSGKLVGIISEADCMKVISDSRYFNMPILDKSVSQFMSKNVQTISHNASIFEAASMFHSNSRRRLPVLKNDQLVGQISRKDVVIAALKLSSQRW